MTFRMQQQLQEFGFEVVDRAGAKQSLEEGPDWLPGEKEEAFGPCPQAIQLEEALRRVGRPQTDIVAMLSDGEVQDDNEAISWERTPLEISSLQKDDESIARVFYWAELVENLAICHHWGEPHLKGASNPVRTGGTGVLVEIERADH